MQKIILQYIISRGTFIIPAENNKNMQKSLTILIPGKLFSNYFVHSLIKTQSAHPEIKIKLAYESIVYNVRNVLLGGNQIKGKYQTSDIDTDFVLWIDSDAVWQPKDIDTIYNSAIENNLDILSGWCKLSDGNCTPFFHLTENWGTEKGFREIEKRITESDHESLPDIFQVRFVGGHFTIMKTSIFEKISYPWFYPVPFKNNGCDLFVGEDTGFCYKAFTEAGIKCYVNKNIKIGHEKSKILY